MERNINTFPASLIKDEYGNVTPSGCPVNVSCLAQNFGEERIATAMGENLCAVTSQIGSVLPLAGSAISNVLTIKLKDPVRGFIWVSKTSYDSGFPDCNDCCVALPTLATPENFVATPGDTEVVMDWDDVADADEYVLEMDTNSSFTGATEIYRGAVSAHTETGLVNGTDYFFRVKAIATGKNDSEWAFATATPAP